MPPRHEGRAPRLLVVAANTDKGLGLAHRLQAERWELVLAPLAVAAADWIGKLQADLILLSPPAGNSETLSVCRLLAGETNLPIAVVSPNKDDLFVAQVLGLGVEAYLAESVGNRELVARLDALLRRLHRRQEPAGTLEVGGLLLSAVDQTVQCRDRRVTLSPIEFRLLRCLASAPGSVFTHEELMTRVWSAEHIDSRHYLSLYIHYLRKKLEDEPARPKLILSERAVGYRFQPPDPTQARAAPP